MGLVDPNSLRSELREALLGLTSGQVSKIAHIPEGYAILEIIPSSDAKESESVGSGQPAVLTALQAPGAIRFTPDVSGIGEAQSALFKLPKLPGWGQDLKEICQTRKDTYRNAIQGMEGLLSPANSAQASDLDPLDLTQEYYALGQLFAYAGNMDKAIAQYLKTIDLDPRIPDTYDFLSDAYAKKGMYKEAIAEEQKFLRLLADEEAATILGNDFESYGYQKAKQRQVETALNSYLDAAKQQYVSPMLIAAMYAQLDKKDVAFEWINKALEERSPWLMQIKTDPQFENLRSDPRFPEILRRVGLPQ